VPPGGDAERLIAGGTRYGLYGHGRRDRSRRIPSHRTQKRYRQAWWAIDGISEEIRPNDGKTIEIIEVDARRVIDPDGGEGERPEHSIPVGGGENKNEVRFGGVRGGREERKWEQKRRNRRKEGLGPSKSSGLVFRI
jgi:hypothetical protein